MNFTIVHYISAAYLVISILLMLTRKHRLKLLTLIPPVAQVASVILLSSMTPAFPLPITALLILLNVAVLIWLDMIEKKEMGVSEPENVRGEGREKQKVSVTEKKTAFSVDSSLLNSARGLAGKEDEKKSEKAAKVEMAEEAKSMPVLPDPQGLPGNPLTVPEVENKPINELGPSQEIFDASQKEVEQMIDGLLDVGDLENAKKYLRMLAFFAKDDSTRKLAERKLAKLNT